MSSRFRLSLLALLALAGCDRETRDYRSLALQSNDRPEAFGGNAFHLAQGQRLYAWMNCAGCHSHGGSMAELVSTILNGRPNGMPSFRDKITEDQAWQLATYVRSLSARTRQDMLAGRADEVANVEPPVLDERKAVHRVTAKQDDATEE
jgi:cytochrome c oxidase cbb3-type subunit III